MASGSTPSEYEVIGNLIEQGWIPLRQMAVLLGMNELRGIYARQKGKNRIPTVRIGGVERVYAETVTETLSNAKANQSEHAGVTLTMYLTALREHNRREKQSA